MHNRQLLLNFELWVEFFCVPTCFCMRIPKPCLSVGPSVCLYPEKRNHPSLVNISPTLVNDTSMEMFSRVLLHGNPKNWISFKKRSKFNFDLCWRAEITLASSISVLHLVNDTWMERSSRILYHEKKKFDFIKEKRLIAVMFCKQFLAYTVHIDWCYHFIHKHSSRSHMHLYDDIGDASSSFRGRHVK